MHVSKQCGCPKGCQQSWFFGPKPNLAIQTTKVGPQVGTWGPHPTFGGPPPHTQWPKLGHTTTHQLPTPPPSPCHPPWAQIPIPAKGPWVGFSHKIWAAILPMEHPMDMGLQPGPSPCTWGVIHPLGTVGTLPHGGVWRKRACCQDWPTCGHPCTWWAWGLCKALVEVLDLVGFLGANLQIPTLGPCGNGGKLGLGGGVKVEHLVHLNNGPHLAVWQLWPTLDASLSWESLLQVFLSLPTPWWPHASGVEPLGHHWAPPPLVVSNPKWP